MSICAQAHLFVFYFGLMSMITPPVALASFAAAKIADAGAWETSVEAIKLAWPAYIVPFLFLFAPSLILQGSVLQVAWALVSAVIGIFAVTAGIVGYLRGPAGPLLRILLLVGGILSIVPARLFPGAIWTDAIGLALLLFCLIIPTPVPSAGAERRS